MEGIEITNNIYGWSLHKNSLYFGPLDGSDYILGKNSRMSAIVTSYGDNSFGFSIGELTRYSSIHENFIFIFLNFFLLSESLNLCFCMI